MKPMKPGDVIFASTELKDGNFVFFVLDITQDQVLVSTRLPCEDCSPQTAEAIAEQPVSTDSPCDGISVSNAYFPCLFPLAPFSYIPFQGTGFEDNANETGDINAVTWNKTQLNTMVNGQDMLQGQDISYLKFDSNLFEKLALSADKKGAQYDYFRAADVQNKAQPTPAPPTSAPPTPTVLGVFTMTPTSGPPGTTIQVESVNPCPPDSHAVLFGFPWGGGLVPLNSDGSWSYSITVPGATSSAVPWPVGENDILADCVRVDNANDPNVDAPANVALSYRTQRFAVTG
jgi:hypothetical protein